MITAEGGELLMGADLDAAADQLEVRCYPSSDPTFAARVQALIDGSTTIDLTGDTLTTGLIAAYPQVRIVQQAPLANLGHRRVLYIYRDGRP